MLVRTEKIDPKDYAFKKYIHEQKEFDTDELRHTMKTICHVVAEDLKGEEHKFCDKDQLCPLGKYRRPKKLVEAEQRGFTSTYEMAEADKKGEEEKKQKQTDAQQKEIDELKELVRQLLAKP